MKRFIFSALALSTVSVLAAGCVTETSSPEGVPVEPGAVIGRSHLMLTDQARAELDPVKYERAAKTLTNYGGPTLTHVKVVPIYWNSSVQYQSNLTSFYSDIVTSSTIYTGATALLAQYSGIGAGTTGTPIVNTSSATTVHETEVQSYVCSLPASSGTYYPVHFAPGVTVIDTGNTSSCVTWCAFHGTYVCPSGSTNAGATVYYGIIPDQGGGCAGGCGTNSQRVNNLTSVSSHELVEATTDPGVGLATTYAPPLAWYNKTYGEIGDICNGQQATITANGHSWVVQKEWSNAGNACKTVK